MFVRPKEIAALLVLFALLAACGGPSRPPVQPPPAETQVRTGGGVSTASFAAVVNRVEPMAESLCRARGVVSDCDFRILLDTRPDSPANAYQTLDRNGRPLLVVTSSLLEDMRNNDEVAFVLGHEAAHHIEGHIARTSTNAQTAAVLAGVLVAAGGGNADAIRMAQQAGAFAGSRAYSKNFELEADVVGTVIAKRAGYDPVRGSAFFTRIADPGDAFLGTHPPNADRIRIVRETASQL